jgi:hypothetical protein
MACPSRSGLLPSRQGPAPLSRPPAESPCSEVLSQPRLDDGSMTTPSATFANTSRRRARGRRRLENPILRPALFPLEMVARFLELQGRFHQSAKTISLASTLRAS